MSHPDSRVWYIKRERKRGDKMSEIFNNPEVFGAGLLFGFAAAWTHMLLIIKWEQRQHRKRDNHARHVELLQAELDEVARRIREECV